MRGSYVDIGKYVDQLRVAGSAKHGTLLADFVQRIEMITVFADGACHAGVGAWAYFVCSEKAIWPPHPNLPEIVFGAFGDGTWHQIRQCRAERNTTNNVMELKALTQALRTLPKDVELTAVLDSKYVITCAENGPKWRAAGWRNTSGVVKNIEHVSDLLEEVYARKVQFRWVKGHTTKTSFYHLGNAVVDAMAQSARKTLMLRMA